MPFSLVGSTGERRRVGQQGTKLTWPDRATFFEPTEMRCAANPGHPGSSLIEIAFEINLQIMDVLYFCGGKSKEAGEVIGDTRFRAEIRADGRSLLTHGREAGLKPGMVSCAPARLTARYLLV